MNLPAHHPRDQEHTPFAKILDDLCASAGVRSAALVDREGETVDYAGKGEPFDIRILAAEWRLILHRVAESAILGSTIHLAVRAKRKSFLLVTLPEGYALIIELGRRSVGASERALAHTRRALCREAGFCDDQAAGLEWLRVEVREEKGHTRRPQSISREGAREEVLVLGRIFTPEYPTERSFRVRLASGEERTLVREPFGHWYIEN